MFTASLKQKSHSLQRLYEKRYPADKRLFYLEFMRHSFLDKEIAKTVAEQASRTESSDPIERFS